MPFIYLNISVWLIRIIPPFAGGKVNIEIAPARQVVGQFLRVLIGVFDGAQPMGNH